MKSAMPGCSQHVPMDKQTAPRLAPSRLLGKGPTVSDLRRARPQGGLISPLLANFALDGMEQAVQAVAQAGRQSQLRALCR